MRKLEGEFFSTEIWRSVVGFSDLYEVSDQGRVRACSRQGSSGKIIRLDKTRDGYFKVSLWRAGCRTKRFIHHVVLEAFVGPRSEGMEGRHLDDDSANNCISNLCWGTKLENAADRRRNNKGHWISLATVVSIRMGFSQGKTARYLAKTSGASLSQVRRIRDFKQRVGASL